MSDASGRRTLRLATYNVHACVGVDRRCDPDRIARVIEELDADVVALQEFAYPADIGIESTDPRTVTSLADYHCALGPTRRHKNQSFGNVLLTRHPIRSLERIDLSSSRREPRGALEATIDVGGETLHVLATHLGLQLGERRVQVGKLVERLVARHASFSVVLGDFNDWVPGRSVVRALEDLLGPTAKPRSFPSTYPLLALDRIWVQPRHALRSIVAHTSALARRASDHLPVIAEIELAPPA